MAKEITSQILLKGETAKDFNREWAKWKEKNFGEEGSDQTKSLFLRRLMKIYGEVKRIKSNGVTADKFKELLEEVKKN